MSITTRRFIHNLLYDSVQRSCCCHLYKGAKAVVLVVYKEVKLREKAQPDSHFNLTNEVFNNEL